jgi:hypothetical protein
MMLAGIVATVSLAACGRSKAAPTDLAGELDAATGDTSGLLPNRGGTQYVSAIERTPGATPAIAPPVKQPKPAAQTPAEAGAEPGGRQVSGKERRGGGARARSDAYADPGRNASADADSHADPDADSASSRWLQQHGDDHPQRAVPDQPVRRLADCRQAGPTTTEHHQRRRGFHPSAPLDAREHRFRAQQYGVISHLWG